MVAEKEQEMAEMTMTWMKTSWAKKWITLSISKVDNNGNSITNLSPYNRIKVYMICKHFNGLLIGQMMFFAEWNVILYLCSPILNDINSLQSAGLFINDLAMHDFSRDLLLTGTFLVTLNQLLFYQIA